MEATRIRALIAGLAVLVGCSFDSKLPAPFVEAPDAVGACGDTAMVFPKLLEFLSDGKFQPLKDVIEKHLVPTADNPTPDPSVRTLLDAIVQLLHAIGLSQAATTASLIANEKALQNTKPLVVTVLKFIEGDPSATPPKPDHYPATEAAAVMLRRCDADFLLTAISAVLRLKSPSHNNRIWLSVVGEEVIPLLMDPTLKPFLDTFQKDAMEGKGRPSVIALLDQILGFIADDGFTISRIQTLLESAVYPAVNDTLKAKIDVLVSLLGEATDPRTGILSGIQGALRCGIMHPAERDQLVGLVYDLVTDPAIGFDNVLATVKMLTSDADAARVESQLADVIDALDAEKDSRSSVLELAAILLTRPEIAEVTPVLIEVIDEGVVTELFEAVQKLISGCNRAAH